MSIIIMGIEHDTHMFVLSAVGGNRVPQEVLGIIIDKFGPRWMRRIEKGGDAYEMGFRQHSIYRHEEIARALFVELRIRAAVEIKPFIEPEEVR